MALITSGTTRPVPSVAWTDDPVPVGQVPKAVYVTELRAFLNVLSSHYHIFTGVQVVNSGTELPNLSFTWTDDPIVALSTDVKAVHWTELRANIQALSGHNHYVNSYGRYASTYTQGFTWSGPILPNYKTDIEAVQVNEIRDAADIMATHTHSACCECECTCTCTCKCECECECECNCDCDCTCDWHT